MPNVHITSEVIATVSLRAYVSLSDFVARGLFGHVGCYRIVVVYRRSTGEEAQDGSTSRAVQGVPHPQECLQDGGAALDCKKDASCKFR